MMMVKAIIPNALGQFQLFFKRFSSSKINMTLSVSTSPSLTITWPFLILGASTLAVSIASSTIFLTLTLSKIRLGRNTAWVTSEVAVKTSNSISVSASKKSWETSSWAWVMLVEETPFSITVAIIPKPVVRNILSASSSCNINVLSVEAGISSLVC